MAEGYQALTAKEKEALRLLLGGHDAKSMASQLGLSAHMISARRRDAAIGWRPAQMQMAPLPPAGGARRAPARRVWEFWAFVQAV